MTDKQSKNRQPNPATLAVWAGEESKDGWQGSTQVPVVHSVSFGYKDLDDWYDVALGRNPVISTVGIPTPQ